MTYNYKEISKIANESNERDLNLLHPKVKEKVEILLKEANKALEKDGLTVSVIQAFRGEQSQNKKKKQGLSNASFGSSLHNYGCAVDVAIFSNNRKVYADGLPLSDERRKKANYHHNNTIKEIGKRLGFFWGGDFRSIKGDIGHYQFTGKYDNNTFLSLVKSGKTVDELLED